MIRRAFARPGGASPSDRGSVAEIRSHRLFGTFLDSTVQATETRVIEPKFAVFAVFLD